MEEEIKKMLYELQGIALSKSEADLWLALLPSMTDEEKSSLSEILKERLATGQ